MYEQLGQVEKNAQKALPFLATGYNVAVDDSYVF